MNILIYRSESNFWIYFN